MGTIYQASCPCGFRQIDLLQGYGIQQHERHYQVYQCESCHCLTSLELSQQDDTLFKPVRCPECKSSMLQLPLAPEKQSFRCPECQENQLHLQITQLWD